MEIKRRIVAPGHGTFVKPNPIYFAVHSTANPGATAANHVSYWSGAGKNYAVHLVSDWKEAYQCVEFDRVCWQVGNGNKTCIGLEICEATNKADFERGLNIARSVILQVLNRYGWTVDRNVRSHKWFTENYGGSDHTDPVPYLAKWGWSWNKFTQFLKDGDDMLTNEEIEAIGQSVWDRGVQLSSGKWVESGKVLAGIYEEEKRTDDPTGRGNESTTHTHVKWIGKTVSDNAKRLDDIEKTLQTILKKLQ